MDPFVTSSYATPADSGDRHSVLRDMVVGKDNIGFFKNQMQEDTGDEEDPPPRLSLPGNHQSENAQFPMLVNPSGKVTEVSPLH